METGQANTTDDHCAYITIFLSHEDPRHMLLSPHFTDEKVEV